MVGTACSSVLEGKVFVVDKVLVGMLLVDMALVDKTLADKVLVASFAVIVEQEYDCMG